jgi:hypothetical protein
LQIEKQENASYRRLVGRYVPDSPHFCPDAPTLATSLAVFNSHPDFKDFVVEHPSKLECLIQGYTAPCNAQDLRGVLSLRGCENAHVVAVDQIALPAIYKQLGAEMPEVEFVQADASDLGGRLGKRTFHMIIQDFILNCLPPVFAMNLLNEARRHLREDGLCLFSFSAEAHHPDTRTISVREGFAPWDTLWTPRTPSLHDMARSDAELQQMRSRLLGATVRDPETGHILQVTAPSGQFEFFQRKAEVITMMEAAGFAVTLVGETPAVDYSGLHCIRYRVIARPV